MPNLAYQSSKLHTPLTLRPLCHLGIIDFSLLWPGTMPCMSLFCAKNKKKDRQAAPMCLYSSPLAKFSFLVSGLNPRVLNSKDCFKWWFILIWACVEEGMWFSWGYVEDRLHVNVAAHSLHTLCSCQFMIWCEHVLKSEFRETFSKNNLVSVCCTVFVLLQALPFWCAVTEHDHLTRRNALHLYNSDVQWFKGQKVWGS